MAKKELGTKRVDPETGKKFYDLNRDPIISPYTGLSYPLSYFESKVDLKDDEEEMEGEELDTVLEKPEFISLEEADDESKAHDALPDLEDDDVDIDDDAFLQDDDSEDGDVAEIIGSSKNDDSDL